MEDDDVVDIPDEGSTSHICRDCGSTFCFSAGERSFFNERDWPDPVRCHSCRRRRANERLAGHADGWTHE